MTEVEDPRLRTVSGTSLNPSPFERGSKLIDLNP